jgi:hypothetical protein
VEKKGKHKASAFPPTPINNFPNQAYGSYDGGMTDAVTLEIFSLRRQNAELKSNVEGLNNKLTRCLETLNSTKRFLRLWIHEGQGESYDQIHIRMRSIDVTINVIEDRSIGPAPKLEIPDRWKKGSK